MALKRRESRRVRSPESVRCAEVPGRDATMSIQVVVIMTYSSVTDPIGRTAGLSKIIIL